MNERIKELLTKYPEPWLIEKEPHSYSDGTTEFTHVRYRAKRDWAKGEEVCVEIGSHVTPDLAELLVLLRQNADALTGGGWRTDFEDAPKDGSEIMLAHWHSHDVPGGPFADYAVGAWDVEDCGGEGGWATNEGLDPIPFEPTHWMPIPVPPQTTAT